MALVLRCFSKAYSNWFQESSYKAWLVELIRKCHFSKKKKRRKYRVKLGSAALASNSSTFKHVRGHEDDALWCYTCLLQRRPKWHLTVLTPSSGLWAHNSVPELVPPLSFWIQQKMVVESDAPAGSTNQPVSGFWSAILPPGHPLAAAAAPGHREPPAASIFAIAFSMRRQISHGKEDHFMALYWPHESLKNILLLRIK